MTLPRFCATLALACACVLLAVPGLAQDNSPRPAADTGFCIRITISVDAVVISRDLTASCYATFAQCDQDAPRVAHQVIPIPGRLYAFRCVPSGLKS